MSPKHDITARLAALRSGEVHLWLAWIEADSMAAKLYSTILSDEEQIRADKMQVADARNKFVVAHALVRAVLSQYHPVPPDVWQFGRERLGKSFLRAPAGVPPLQFNLTHTHGLAACAVAFDVAVGVDAERIVPLADLPEVARRFFSSSEARELECLSDERRMERFYEIWTIKEAVSKAAGVGFSSPVITNTAGWCVAQKKVSAEHILTAAVRGGLTRKISFRLRTVNWRKNGEEFCPEAQKSSQVLPAINWPNANR